jgi:hypothetical protein
MVYCHMGFGSIYERDRLFMIRKGLVEGQHLRINAPKAAEYEILPDGSRRLFDDGFSDAREPVDPYGPDETPQGRRFWQAAADHLDEEEAKDRARGASPDDYVVAGWTMFGELKDASPEL